MTNSEIALELTKAVVSEKTLSSDHEERAEQTADIYISILKKIEKMYD